MIQKLGDIATYINGYAFKPADRGSKGLPIIRIQDLTGNSYDLGFYDGIYPKKIEINNGDILISWSGSLGIFLWNGGKALLNQHIFKVVFDKKDIDKNYFLFAVKEKLNEMSLKTHGATMKHIIKSDFENITISLPELNEQKRISNMLLKIENLIKMRKTQIQHYDTLTKSIFVEMFGDPITNPYQFKKIFLSELAEIRIGPFGSLLHTEDYVFGKHPIVNPSHIINDEIVPDNKLTISNEKYVELSSYHLHKNDIILGRRGEMGRCAIVQREGLLCGTGSLLIRATQKVSADFIQKVISFPSFKKYIQDMAVGQTMPNLNVPIVSKFLIITPPLYLQKEYYNHIKKIDKHKLLIID